jgi:hypothetical protein
MALAQKSFARHTPGNLPRLAYIQAVHMLAA